MEVENGSGRNEEDTLLGYEDKVFESIFFLYFQNILILSFTSFSSLFGIAGGTIKGAVKAA